MFSTRLLVAVAFTGIALPAFAAAPPGKPIPAMTPQQHEVEMKKEQAEWNNMTPAQKADFRAKRRAEFLARIKQKAPPHPVEPKKPETPSAHSTKALLPGGNVPANITPENAPPGTAPADPAAAKSTYSIYQHGATLGKKPAVKFEK